MNYRFDYNKMLEIKSKDENLKKIDQLDHAYRLNGLVDFYKTRNKNGEIVLLDLTNTIYHRFVRETDAISFIKKVLSENEERETFSSKVNGKITFKAFMKNREKADWRPENYQWDQFKHERSNDGSSIYFIKDGIGRIKIGRSNNIQNRIKSLQTGSPTKLELVFEIFCRGHLEKNFHNCFSDLKLVGEWFTYTSRFDDFFKYVKDNPYKTHAPIKLKARAEDRKQYF